jgi:hypothetical protein
MDSVLHRHEPYVTVIARRPGEERHLVALRVEEGQIYRILVADPLLEGVPPSRVQWWTNSEAGPIFDYSHDFPTEGMVFTLVYTSEADSLRLSYYDRERVCRSSELRDLDGDGVPELLARSDHLIERDCSAHCSLEFAHRFPDAAHWVTVHRWTGSEWVPAEREHPEFYRALAAEYRRAAVWFSGEPDACPYGRWARDRVANLTRWAERAEALSR